VFEWAAPTEALSLIKADFTGRILDRLWLNPATGAGLEQAIENETDAPEE
jgi:hypothetical protein